jgi:ribonuclease HI
MTAEEIRGLGDRKDWKCEGCLGIMAGKLPEAETSTPAFKTNATEYISKLNILQWNADAILAKIEPLREYLNKMDIHVFFIQETKLTPKDRIENKLPEFTIKRRDRLQPKGKERNRGGGLLVGIRKGTPYREARIDLRGDGDEITESYTIEIPRKNNQKLRLTNIYIPPIRNTVSEAARQRGTGIDTDNWPCQPYDCLFGDVNAHSPLWDKAYEEADERGEMVEEWIGGSGMVTLNDGDPTRLHRNCEDTRRMKDTAPDISAVHSSLAERFTVWKTDNELNSDHLPIVMRYEEPSSIPSVKSKDQYRWKLKEANWASYTEDVEKNIPRNYQAKSGRKLEKILSKAMISAANKHVRKKKIGNNTKPYLSKELKEAIKERNRLRATRAANRKEWVEAANRVTEMTRTEREKKWKEYVGTLDMSTNPAQVWRTIHNIEGKHPAKSENEVLTFEGEALVDDKDKANAFAKTYKQFSRIPTRKSDRKIRRSVRNRMKTNTTPLEESEQEITIQELERVIEEAGLKKAAGEDDIPYELIKHLGKKAREMLLHLYNKCWTGEGIPNKWRTAIIKTLLKEGKDAKDTTSYRPISLTSCMGKLLEKIIADRLTYIMESRGLISDAQAGFRQNRCTTDQILKMTQHAADQMQAKSGQNATIVTFFDYAKAYDKVWRDGLLHKMLEMNLPQRFVKYTRSFLSNRQTTVDINGTRSKKFMLNEGLPQGSSISPLLFIIFINDIGVDLHDLTIASLFADDTSVWVPGGRENRDEACARMQTEVEKIMDWAQCWKMSINVDKTRTMVISSSTADMKTDPKLNADQDKIKLVESYRFLGVTIDNGLRFGEHVKTVIEKSRKRVRILKCMAWKDWGNSNEVQRTLYLQYVRSCLEYASPAWASLIEKTKLEQLERVQNEALRCIAGLYKTCPVDFLRLETNIEPLRDRFLKNDEILFDKYLRLPRTDSRRRLVDTIAPTRLLSRHGWRKVTTERVDHNLPRDEYTQPSAPWRNLSRLTVEYVNLDRKKSEYQPEELKALTLEKIATYDADYYIYTDGSTNGRQEQGGAGMFIEDWTGETVAEKSFPAGKYCSSYTGECVGMLEAVKWTKAAEANQAEPLKVLVCSDSKSMADALHKNHWKNDDFWLKQITDEIYEMDAEMTLLWIPSHCDVDGNERADDLAKQGSELNQAATPVVHKIVKAKIKNRKWEVTYPRALEVYGDRRAPKLEVEKLWERDVRTMYSRFRTGHEVELKRYKCDFLQLEDDSLCERGCEESETTEHVLCRCDATMAARARLCEGEVKMRMMTTEPNTCRKILMSRYGQLRLPCEKASPLASQSVAGRSTGLVGETTCGVGSPRDTLA